jgi:hypothetical protein
LVIRFYQQYYWTPWCITEMVFQSDLKHL